MKTYYAIIWCLISTTNLTFAKKSKLYYQKFSFGEKGNIKVIFPNNWRATKDFMGMPLTLSGPMIKKRRAIITFTPTGLKKLKFELDEKKSQNDYILNRKKWLQKHKGKVDKFLKHESVQFNNSSGYRVGYQYRINNLSFKESSYYLVCKNKFFHIKYLLSEGNFRYEKDVEKIIRSFDC